VHINIATTDKLIWYVRDLSKHENLGKCVWLQALFPQPHGKNSTINMHWLTYAPSPTEINGH